MDAVERHLIIRKYMAEQEERHIETMTYINKLIQTLTPVQREEIEEFMRMSEIKTNKC